MTNAFEVSTIRVSGWIEESPLNQEAALFHPLTQAVLTSSPAVRYDAKAVLRRVL